MAFNLVFITQEDPFYVRLFFEELLARYPQRSEIAAIVIAPTMGKKSIWKLVRQMYDFYGLFDFVRVGVRYVAYKLADRLPPVLVRGRYFSIEKVARHYGVPVWHCGGVNAPDFLERLRAVQPDLIVSVAAPQIFKAPLLAAARLGSINIHNSKLPRYRGMLPNFWQMFHGENVVGTTIHRINAALDDGAILFQTEAKIISGESLDSLICRTKRAGAELMIEAIGALRDGRAREIENPREQASYFTFPTRADVREFRRRGYRLI